MSKTVFEEGAHLTDEEIQQKTIERRKEVAQELNDKGYGGQSILAAIQLAEYAEVCFHVAAKTVDRLIMAGILKEAEDTEQTADGSTVDWRTKAIFEVAMAIMGKSPITFGMPPGMVAPTLPPGFILPNTPQDLTRL